MDEKLLSFDAIDELEEISRRSQQALYAAIRDLKQLAEEHDDQATVRFTDQELEKHASYELSEAEFHARLREMVRKREDGQEI